MSDQISIYEHNMDALSEKNAKLICMLLSNCDATDMYVAVLLICIGMYAVFVHIRLFRCYITEWYDMYDNMYDNIFDNMYDNMYDNICMIIYMIIYS